MDYRIATLTQDGQLLIEFDEIPMTSLLFNITDGFAAKVLVNPFFETNVTRNTTVKELRFLEANQNYVKAYLSFFEPEDISFGGKGYNDILELSITDKSFFHFQNSFKEVDQDMKAYAKIIPQLDRNDENVISIQYMGSTIEKGLTGVLFSSIIINFFFAASMN